MKKISVGMFFLGVTSSILFAMNLDTQIMSSTQAKIGSVYKDSYDVEKDHSNDLSEALQSIESLAQQFDTDLKKPYSEKSLLRATFEQKNEEILDKVSLDTLQNYLVCNYGEKSKSNDLKAPWLVNYWYDHSNNIDLIKSLSKGSLSESLDTDSSKDSDTLLIDLTYVNKDDDVSKLVRLVKKYAYSVKKMYAYNKNSIVVGDRSIAIKNQSLRTLYGIDKIINGKMTLEQKNHITSVFLDSNKLRFPDVKRIRNLFTNVKVISYESNPLQYIYKTDLDMSAGSRLNFCSTQNLVSIPTARLSSLPYLQLVFSKKSLSQDQIDSLKGIQYSSDRNYYCVRNGFLETLATTALFSGGTTITTAVLPLALAGLHGGSVNDLSLLASVAFPVGTGISSFFSIVYCLGNIVNRGGAPAYSLPYFKHDIVLTE